MKNVCILVFVFSMSFNAVAEIGAVFRNEFGAQIAQNIDWFSSFDKLAAMIVINPAGVEKTADLLGMADRPHTWKATNKSFTFTVMAADFPISGFNEHGLEMGIFLPNDSTDALVEAAQFVQFQLDTASTVKDVIASASTFPAGPAFNGRYFVCDKSRDCAAIRYVDGKMRVEEAKDLRLLGNSSEAFQLQAYRALDRAAQKGDFVTRFQVIFDPTGNRIYVRRHGQTDMAWANVNFKTVKPAVGRRAIVIESDVRGNLTAGKRLEPITADLQLQVIRQTGLSGPIAEKVSNYLFQSVTCVEELTVPDENI